MTKYAVMDSSRPDSEWMYATHADNPFTYDSTPIIFLDKAKAEHTRKDMENWCSCRVQG
jgi:hypothetical protein